MNKNLINIIFFILLFFIFNNLIYARTLNFALNQGEKLLKIYLWENFMYILSTNSNYIILKKFDNNNLNQISSIWLDGQIVDLNFVESGDNLFIYALANYENIFKLIVFNHNLQVVREINLIGSLNNNFVISVYSKEQDKFILIFKTLNRLKLLSLNVNNYNLIDVDIGISSKEKFIKLFSDNFYNLLVNYDEIGGFYKIYLLNSNLSLIYQNSLDNYFLFFDITKSGSVYYLCGKNFNGYFYLAKFNVNNLNLSYYLKDNLKIDNQVRCKYIEGDLNELIIFYIKDNKFYIKNLRDSLDISFNFNNSDIREIKNTEPEVFNGNINLIFSNLVRSLYVKVNIFGVNNPTIINFSDYEYIDNYFDYLDDKIMILFEKNSRGLIYSEF
ncbi:MAG: hypothetical protein KatS3mg095_0786 [Candidatus Parcubacteria bacterium]|nr:MAG: hypothetical protein KatS3mg095_0786 [Candidatus Parcubacteria bacterium]